MESETFEAANAGASLTTPGSVGDLRKNGYCMLKGHPVRIVEINTAKVGKHGSSKSKITGIDIFSGNKYEEIHPTGHNIDIPNIARVEFTLVDIGDDGFVSLMDDAGNSREDLKLENNDECNKIRDMFGNDLTVAVTVLKAMGTEKIIAGKEI